MTVKKSNKNNNTYEYIHLIYSIYLPVDVDVGAIILLEVKANEEMSECGVVLVRGSEGVIVVDVVKSKIPLEVKKDEVLSGCGVVLVRGSKSVVIVDLGKSKISLEVKADEDIIVVPI